MRPIVFFAGQICRLIGLCDWACENARMEYAYWTSIAILRMKGYEQERITRIMNRLYRLKVEMPRKRKIRENQLEFNDLVVNMSEQYGVSQHQVREFLREKFYINS